jgi:hypothetical protein
MVFHMIETISINHFHRGWPGIPIFARKTLAHQELTATDGAASGMGLIVNRVCLIVNDPFGRSNQ